MITVISGTNRPQSVTRVISLYYQEILSSLGAQSQLLDLHDLPPDFTYTALYANSGKNTRFNQFREMVETSQKFVFVVPEYNNSFPGVLKAFIDGLKYPDSFANKKAALVGVSTGVQGGSIALSHLSDVLAYMGMNMVGLQVKLGRLKEFMADGKITFPIYNDMLALQAKRLVEF